MSERPWHPVNQPPSPGVIVSLRHSDGSIIDAVYSSNADRECYLTRGTGGQFWRSFMGPTQVEWQYKEVG